MKDRLILTIACILIYVSTFGQTFEKVIFNDKNPDDYYLMLRPNTDQVKGVLVLLPGYGQYPESIFPESKLFNAAYANGIITIAISKGQTKLRLDRLLGKKPLNK